MIDCMNHSRDAARRLAIVATSTLALLSVGCGGEDDPVRVEPTATVVTNPFDESLQRVLQTPETEGLNGPWTLQERLDFYRVPGVAIHAWDGDRTVERALGVAQEDVEMSTRTAVPVGPHLSSGVSALVVAAQLSRTSRDLNASLREEVGGLGLPPALDDVTLGELLSHSARVGPLRIPSSARSVEQLISSLTEELPIGLRDRFSETGYAVVQRYMEALTAGSWSSLAQDRLFGPLGMTDSTYGPPSEPESAAQIHDAGGRPLPRRPSVAPAANGLHTSARDLGLLFRAIQNTFSGEISEPFRERQLRFAFEHEEAGWGMGWRSWAAGCRVAPRPGDDDFEDDFTLAWDPNGHGMVISFLNRPAGAVILTNGEYGRDLAEEILLGLAEDFGWPQFHPVRSTSLPPSEARLNAILGTYDLAGTTIEVTWEFSELKISGLADAALPLIAVREGSWMLTDRPDRVRYDGSRPNQLLVGRQVARRVEPGEPLVDLVTH